jgi:hypothetical protein
MGRKKKPINILISKIENIRGVKLSKKYCTMLIDHLNKHTMHKGLFDAEEYDKLAIILNMRISVWANEKKLKNNSA